MDYGDRYSEKKISAVNRELRKTFRTAQAELKKKLADFEKRHARENKRKKDQLAAGKITKQDYQDWLTGQVFIRNQWQANLRQVCKTMHDANKQAMNIVNNSRFDVFAENYNFNAWQAEKAINVSFNLYNAESVARLMTDEPQLLPEWKIDEEKDYIWNYNRVNNIVRQGIIQGEGIPEITDRLCSGLATSNEAKMRMFARTALGAAQSAGRQQQMEDAAAMGIVVHKRWLAAHDSKTRDAHRDLDGQEVPYDKPFKSELGDIRYPKDPEADAANVFNCFIGETLAATDSDVVRSYKHEYSGKLITVKSACGVKFTCTPNHPILTDRGWIHAESLNDGDHLVIASIGENNLMGIDPHIDHTFPTMDTIHEFINKMGGKRTRCLRVNFHGDVPTTNVEVVTQERFLRNNGDASGGNSINELLFKHTDKAMACKGTLAKHFRRVWLATLRNIGRHRKPLSFVRRGVRHADKHRFGSVSQIDATLFKAKNDAASCDADFFSKCFDGLPGNVFIDNVIEINISSANHIPVYNLQTQNGYYFVNSIVTESDGKCNGIFAIAHNCRCTMVTIYPKYEDYSRKYGEGVTIDGQSYQEWKNGKQKRGEMN